jgi:hypothetical protein
MKQGQFTAAVFLLVSALIIGPTVVFPQVPVQINLHGRLTDDLGMPRYGAQIQS